MMWNQLKYAALVTATVGLLGSGAGVAVHLAAGMDQGTPFRRGPSVPVAAADAKVVKSWRGRVDDELLAQADVVFVGRVAKAASLIDAPAPGFIAPTEAIEYEVLEVFKGDPGKQTAINYRLYVPGNHMDPAGRTRLDPERFAQGQLHLVYAKQDLAQHVAFLDIVAAAAAPAITGTAVDEAGKPVPGAEVWVFASRDAMKAKPREPLAKAKADKNGVFTVEKLPARDSYHLSAFFSGKFYISTEAAVSRKADEAKVEVGKVVLRKAGL